MTAQQLLTELLNHLPLRVYGSPPVIALMRELGLQQGDMVYLETCHGHGPLIIRLDVGSRLPIATSAIGRAWMCGLSDERRQQVMQELAAFHGSDWPRLNAGIEQRWLSSTDCHLCDWSCLAVRII